MRTNVKEIESALGELDPSVGADPTWAEESRAILEKILAGDAESSMAPARPEGQRRRRLVLVAALVCVAAATVVLVGLPGGGHVGGSGALASLERVARAAAARPSPDAHLPYLYTKTAETNLDTAVAGGKAFSVYESEIDETWFAPDAAGRIRRIRAPVRWASSANRMAWIAAGRPDFLAAGFGGHVEAEEIPAGARAPGDEALARMPAGPADLAAWLERETAGQKNGIPPVVRTLDLVAEILHDPRATPAQRAALYEAEALVPEVREYGVVKDLDGRVGVAVGAESANSGAPTRYLLIFDPLTSAVLATEQITLRPAAAMPAIPTPAVTEARLFYGSGRVGAIGERPGASGG